MKNLRLHFLGVCIGLSLSASGYTSTVRNDISYQIYRDFAENKGVFKPGAVNIPIYDNSGNLVGTLNQAPMPDFSSVDSLGIATLVDPQHVVSVKHNGGYQSVKFGGSDTNPDKNAYNYQIVDRNNSPSLDFHAPRLNKLVTEVIPATVTAQGAINNAYSNKTRYPVFYRIGSGTQYVKDKNGKLVQMSGAYNYLTGGTVGSPGSYQNGEMISSGTGSTFSPIQGPLASYGEAGDSGSPLFAYDTLLSKWVLVGVLTAGNGPGCCGNNWAVIPLGFLKNTLNEDNDPDVLVNATAEPVIWSFNSASGIGTLQQGGQYSVMHGQKGSDLNAGKNLTFIGAGGTIQLDDSVSQGAGALTFTHDYLFTTHNNSVWSGAGIIVADDAKVTWQVNGVQGDELHKLGTGTLYVNATGVNQGALRVGDGTVFLDQQADSTGKKQVFSRVTLTSGRPTVVLSDSNQIDPNNIYFGYRGGRLDLNGNDITLSRLKAADSGAQVVNHNTEKSATVTLTGNGTNNVNTDQIFMGVFGETDSTRANGELNIHYRPPSEKGYLVLTGGANVNGTLFVDNGNALLSGAPVLHANNVYLDDWTPSGFIFSQINIAADKGLQIGQYATVLADINAQANSHVVVGYNNGSNDSHNTRKCTVNNNTGVTNCVVRKLTDSQRAELPYSSLTGDMTLADGASLTLGKAIYTGVIQGAESAMINMASDSRWFMPSDSTVGTLSMMNGASVALSELGNTGSGNTLTVQGDLDGSGNFELHTQVAGKTGDRIIVNGLATGDYTLAVRDDGGDPIQDGGMQALMSLTNPHQDFEHVNVTLAGGYADIGTYRYRLTRKDSDYMLYNPLVPWQPLEPSVSMPSDDQSHWISHGANTAISAFTSHFNLLSQQGENTERYLNHLTPGESGLWMTFRTNDLHYGNHSYRPYRQRLTNQSLGADRQTDIPSGVLQWGGVLTNTLSHARFDEGAQSRDSVSGVNLYGKLTLSSGVWLSGYGGIHYLDYSLTGRDSVGSSGMYGYIAGLGAGYAWQSSRGLRVQPDMGMTLYDLPSGKYDFTGNMRVTEAATRTLQYRAGLQVSQEMSIAGLRISPFVQVMHRINAHPEEAIHINQHKLDATLYQRRTELNIGNRLELGDTVHVDLQGGYITGGGLKGSKDISATLKYRF
ncbi:autotransporter outer membrane beta-barrel domain-containing protein [Hafnia paralvei]|uniref:S6 family peptidase n=1 Tax=Hafnia paralvei TaxID=546367 RepID=UPI001033B9C9|nr:S6 family peptidase [Hafnia paralvei]MDX6840847.1 S6 family peptidase [Hafnia paralvei]TBM01115.1 autotransporter outer membrane beta-barrel domain-containing protein [Hafnia paralvei]